MYEALKLVHVSILNSGFNGPTAVKRCMSSMLYQRSGIFFLALSRRRNLYAHNAKRAGCRQARIQFTLRSAISGIHSFYLKIDHLRHSVYLEIGYLVVALVHLADGLGAVCRTEHQAGALVDHGLGATRQGGCTHLIRSAPDRDDLQCPVCVRVSFCFLM